MNKRMWRMVALAAAVLTLGAGCQWPPVPNRVAVTGDSIAWQGGVLGGSYRDATVYAFWGGRAATTMDEIEADVNDPTRSPDVLVMAYGHNYYDTGMNEADWAELTAHAQLPHPDACVVLLLPAYNGPDQRRIDVIGAYRAWARDYQATHPDRAVVLVDWATVVAAHPEFVAEDGLHLTNAGAGPFTETVNAGVDACKARQMAADFSAAGP